MKITKDTMLYVDGSKTAFRCHCGCNVFHPIENHGLKTFECNGCGDWYTDADSEKESDEEVDYE